MEETHMGGRAGIKRCWSGVDECASQMSGVRTDEVDQMTCQRDITTLRVEHDERTPLGEELGRLLTLKKKTWGMLGRAEL